MSTVSFNLPDSVHKKIQELADREGISVDQFLATAAAEKLAAFTAWSIWSSVRPVAAASNCSASSIVFRTCHPIRVTSSDNNGVLRKDGVSRKDAGVAERHRGSLCRLCGSA